MKILDLEGPEEPHVTIYRRASPRWRVSLRTGAVMDREPPARDLPAGLLEAVIGHLGELAAHWDVMHPHNPVGEREPGDE